MHRTSTVRHASAATPLERQEFEGSALRRPPMRCGSAGKVGAARRLVRTVYGYGQSANVLVSASHMRISESKLLGSSLYGPRNSTPMI